MYTLHNQITVHTTLDTAWDFISNPENLNLITPDDMNFRIISPLPEQMFEGMKVEYRVKIPYMGTRRWVSELKQIVPYHSFVDEQLHGPYHYWHHHHVIESTDKGVLFTDQVKYIPPFGPIGKLANHLFIASTLERIFDYRTLRLLELLDQ